MLSQAPRVLRKWSSSPEFNIALFALLLNLPWEFLQVPFFSEMPRTEHWSGVKTCAQATAGAAVIMLLAYWTVALLFRDRRWLCRLTAGQLLIFVGTGVVITVVIERLALAGTWVGSWSYSGRMYVIPLLEVGLSPVLQWIALPPLALWFARGQMSGIHYAHGRRGQAHTRLALDVARHRHRHGNNVAARTAQTFSRMCSCWMKLDVCSSCRTRCMWRSHAPKRSFLPSRAGSSGSRTGTSATPTAALLRS